MNLTRENNRTELTPYVPMVKITMETYRPAKFIVAAAEMKPTTATALDAVICHVRSLNLPDDQDTAMVTAPAMR